MSFTHLLYDLIELKSEIKSIESQIEQINIENESNRVFYYKEKHISALSLLCIDGNVKLLKRLLKSQHLDINDGGGNEEPVLLQMCKLGNEEVVKELLKHEKIDVNVKKYGETPLIRACRYNHTVIAKELLKIDKTYVNDICNEERKSALDYAIRNKNIELIDCLLQRSDIKIFFNETNFYTHEIFDLAKTHPEAMLNLISRIDVNREDDDGETILSFLMYDLIHETDLFSKKNIEYVIKKVLDKFDIFMKIISASYEYYHYSSPLLCAIDADLYNLYSLFDLNTGCDFDLKDAKKSVNPEMICLYSLHSLNSNKWLNMF